ncbi:hypothetical protein VNO78_11681 [Psophocarpus tetragonolobus]|uniref:Uncharacterized protein n=1 Tax=Psophocarpus tetragonolobus TaxID=3891 RepID=A0AAN9SMX3_PSOTE
MLLSVDWWPSCVAILISYDGPFPLALHVASFQVNRTSTTFGSGSAREVENGFDQTITEYNSHMPFAFRLAEVSKRLHLVRIKNLRTQCGPMQVYSRQYVNGPYTKSLTCVPGLNAANGHEFAAKGDEECPMLRDRIEDLIGISHMKSNVRADTKPYLRWKGRKSPE